MMHRQILTHPVDEIAIKRELSFIIEYFLERGFECGEVLFGYAWGMEYYPGAEWNDELILLSDLFRKVEEVEASGLGLLGKDDLFIKFPHLEVQLCHESDIHIHFSDDSPDVEFFFERWKELGYSPAEWVTEGHGPGSKVR